MSGQAVAVGRKCLGWGGEAGGASEEIRGDGLGVAVADQAARTDRKRRACSSRIVWQLPPRRADSATASRASAGESSRRG